MCSRYNLTSPAEVVRAYFDLAQIDDFPPRYNIAPTQPVAIVRLDLQGKAEMALVRWGLLPAWVKDPRAFGTLATARSESAVDKPSFRAAMRYRRCLVPANGFYTWVGRPGARKPHHVHPRTAGPMAFAGLWEHWLGADGSEIDTMAIMTTTANATVAAIDDRMPVILQPADFQAWLDPATPVTVAAALLRAAADDLLTVEAISGAINDPLRDELDVLT